MAGGSGTQDGHALHGTGSEGRKEGRISRLLIRKYLKILIDRSLVLGTVDRPQLHDIVWEYVKTQITAGEFKAAQRRLVEDFRTSTRSKQYVTALMTSQCQ